MTSVESVKRAALEHCSPGYRQNIRFAPPCRRRFSTRLTIENLESVNIFKFSSAIYPAQAFIKHTGTNSELATASRVDVYIPRGLATHLFLLYRFLFLCSISSFGLAVWIVNKKI